MEGLTHTHTVVQSVETIKKTPHLVELVEDCLKNAEKFDMSYYHEN